MPEVTNPKRKKSFLWLNGFKCFCAVVGSLALGPVAKKRITMEDCGRTKLLTHSIRKALERVWGGRFSASTSKTHPLAYLASTRTYLRKSPQPPSRATGCQHGTQAFAGTL